MDELVADVIGMLDALGWARADLVGHDWGGSVAWHVAGRHPERLRSLTAVSTPHPRAFTAGDRQRRRAAGDERYLRRFREPGAAEDALLADDAAALREVLDGLPEAEQLRRALARPDDPDVGAELVPGDAPPRQRETGAVTRADALRLGRGRSGVRPRGRRGDGASSSTAPYTFVPLAGAGHWLPETHADELNQLLLAHLAARALIAARL